MCSSLEPQTGWSANKAPEWWCCTARIVLEHNNLKSDVICDQAHGAMSRITTRHNNTTNSTGACVRVFLNWLCDKQKRLHIVNKLPCSHHPHVSAFFHMPPCHVRYGCMNQLCISKYEHIPWSEIELECRNSTRRADATRCCVM